MDGDGDYFFVCSRRRATSRAFSDRSNALIVSASEDEERIADNGRADNISAVYNNMRAPRNS